MNQKHLLRAIAKTWENFESADFCLSKQFQLVIGGTVIKSEEIQLESHSVYTIIIANPLEIVTDSQLCQIIDEGNHCLSKGSITYEGEYAYITWSNLGHI